MKFKDYQQHTKRTLPVLGDKYLGNASNRILDAVHMKLGIMSEMDELIDALRKDDKVGIGEELTDMLWYIANDLNIALEIGFITQGEYDKIADLKLSVSPMATDGGFKINQSDPAWLSALVYNASIICDQTKKLFAYGKLADKDMYLNATTYLIGAINNISLMHLIDLEYCMNKNIAKLMNRYPEKFTEDAAINRDVVAEREILEGGKATPLEPTI